MIKINKDIGEQIPEGTLYIKNMVEDGVRYQYCYSDADSECRLRRLHQSQFNWLGQIQIMYTKENKKLEQSDNYDNLRDAVSAGIGAKGKSIAETKQAFKDAVLARQALQDNRDTKLQAIQDATTIEEIELITW